MIELKLYAVDKTHQRNIGAQLPQQVGLYSVASEAANIVNQNQSLVNQAIAQGLVPAGASNIDIALALIGSGLVQSTLLSSTIGFFGGGLTQTGVTTNVFPTFNLALNSSDTRALDDIQIRVGDRPDRRSSASALAIPSPLRPTPPAPRQASGSLPASPSTESAPPACSHS